MTLLHAIAETVDYGEHKEFFEECFKYSQHYINAKEFVSGNTPLQLAAEQGYAKNVKYLMQHGANIHEQDEFGRTPLHFAAVAGSRDRNEALECMKLLVEQGADVDAADTHKFETPFIWWHVVNLMDQQR